MWWSAPAGEYYVSSALPCMGWEEKECVFTYLDAFHRPRFHVPFTQSGAFDVVVDEHAFGGDAQDNAVGPALLAGDERHCRFGKGVAELVHAEYDDFVWVFGAVRTAMAGWWRRLSGRLGGGVGLGV